MQVTKIKTTASGRLRMEKIDYRLEIFIFKYFFKHPNPFTSVGHPNQGLAGIKSSLRHSIQKIQKISKKLLFYILYGSCKGPCGIANCHYGQSAPAHYHSKFFKANNPSQRRYQKISHKL
jgi:hypothetical protein